MNRLERFMSASRVAIRMGTDTFLREYSSPGAMYADRKTDWRVNLYNTRWHYYSNSAFDDLTLWRSYISKHRLYKFTRSLYNPTSRLVEFYSGIVQPGVLSLDAGKLPDEVPSAIPLDPATDEELMVAIGQIWRWSRWQTNKALMVRYGATLGDVMVEILDDTEEAIVKLDVVWPGFIVELSLGPQGEITAYAKEFEYFDEEDARVYRYRKEVDAFRFSTYRNDRPWDFTGNGVTWENPYGFVPAVWINHRSMGGPNGAPCMRNMNKFDSLNSVASAAVDQVLKTLHAPILVSGSNITKPQFGGQVPNQGSVTMPGSLAGDSQESINILTGDENSSVTSISPPAGESMAHIEALLAEIEKDHPELLMYIQLREQMYVSASGADRMFGDVASLVYDARSSYDTATIEMLQMAVAIAGMRSAEGAWGENDTSMGKFDNFSLQDYHDEKLEFEILPRPMVPMAPLEAIKLEQSKLELDMMRVDLRMKRRQDREMRKALDQGIVLPDGSPIPQATPTGGPGGSVSSTNPSPQGSNGQFAGER